MLVQFDLREQLDLSLFALSGQLSCHLLNTTNSARVCQHLGYLQVANSLIDHNPPKPLLLEPNWCYKLQNAFVHLFPKFFSVYRDHRHDQSIKRRGSWHFINGLRFRLKLNNKAQRSKDEMKNIKWLFSIVPKLKSSIKKTPAMNWRFLWILLLRLIIFSYKSRNNQSLKG